MPEEKEKVTMIPFALRLTPRLHRNVKLLAAASGESAHSMVTSILEAYCERNQSALAKLKEVAKTVKM